MAISDATRDLVNRSDMNAAIENEIVNAICDLVTQSSMNTAIEGATIAQLTDAVASASDATTDQRDQILELLEVLAQQANRPPEQRRSGAMQPILTELDKCLTKVESLAGIWTRIRSVIASLFGFAWK